LVAAGLKFAKAANAQPNRSGPVPELSGGHVAAAKTAEKTAWTPETVMQHGQQVMNHEATKIVTLYKNHSPRVKKYHVPGGAITSWIKPRYVDIYEMKVPVGRDHGQTTYDVLDVQFGDGSQPANYLHSISIYRDTRLREQVGPLELRAAGTTHKNGTTIHEALCTQYPTGNLYEFGEGKVVAKGKQSALSTTEYGVSARDGAHMMSVSEPAEADASPTQTTSVTSLDSVVKAADKFAAETEAFIHQYS